MLRKVSSCCGCSYEDSFISTCCRVEMYKDLNFLNYQAEKLYKRNDRCPSCNKTTRTKGYICNECGNWFKKPKLYEQSYNHPNY